MIAFWIELLMFICLGVQFIYIFIFSKILFYQEKIPPTTPQHSVSLIIIARNEAENLKSLIPALLHQNYADFEIIIVNDRSTDETQAILEQYQKQDNRLKIIHIQSGHQEINPKKYALKTAIHQAQNEMIMLTDADCMPHSENWIQHIQSKFTHHIGIVLGFSPYFKKQGFLNQCIQFETFYTAVQYFSFTLIGCPYMGVGRNLAYRKLLFTQSNALDKFKEITGGDDDLFINQSAQKNKVAICLNAESYMYSHPKTSWKEWYHQKIRHLSVGKYYHPIHQIILGILHFSQWMLWLNIFYVVFFSVGIFKTTIIMLFLLRILAIWLLFHQINQKLKAQVNSLLIPFFDFLFGFYIFMFGIIAITTNKIRWKS
jgi:glycosyltransferase involved in cell wall biosynthesis